MKGIHYLSGPLRSRQQNGIRSARDLLGEMPGKEQAGIPEHRSQQGESLAAQAQACGRREGEQGWAGRTSDLSAVGRNPGPGGWGVPKLTFPIEGITLLSGMIAALMSLLCSVMAQRQPGKDPSPVSGGSSRDWQSTLPLAAGSLRVIWVAPSVAIYFFIHHCHSFFELLSKFKSS